MSSTASGTTDDAVDAALEASVGLETASGVVHGDLLLRFAEAVVEQSADIAQRRDEVIAAVGVEGAGQAVSTITAFSGLVRVADGTGIPIDDGLAAVSADIRDSLKLDGLGGAENSDLAGVTATSFSTIDALFDNR